MFWGYCDPPVTRNFPFEIKHLQIIFQSWPKLASVLQYSWHASNGTTQEEKESMVYVTMDGPFVNLKGDDGQSIFAVDGFIWFMSQLCGLEIEWVSYH